MTQMRNGVNDTCGKHKKKSDVTNVTSNFKNSIKWYRKIEVARKMSQMRHPNFDEGKMISIMRFHFK